MKDFTTEHLKLADVHPELASKYAQKLHIKKDEIQYVKKFYSSEKAEPSEKEKRTVTSYITTNNIDRDGEILLPEGMKTDHYEAGGKPVFWGHSYHDPKNVVGQNLWLKPNKDGSGIIAKTAFRDNQFAQEVYDLFTDDFTGQGPVFRGWSVGFIPIDWEDGDGKKDSPRRTYKEWELLEYSAVPIPSNRESLTLAYQKGMIGDTLKKQLEEDLDITIEPDDDPDITIDPDIEPTKEHTVDEVTDEALELDPTEKRIEEAIDETKEEPMQELEDEELEGGKAVVEIEEDIEVKAFDMAGNPSVWDIMDAITSAVSTDNQDDWNHVVDLYPVKYPNGHVVVSESKRGEQRKHLLYTYEYDDGVVTLGESKELEASYRPKKRGHVDIGDLQSVMREVREEFAILKEGRILSKKSREAVENASVALIDLLERDEESRVKPEEEVSTEEREVTIEQDKDIDIPDLDEKIGNAVEKALTADKIKKAIEDGADIIKKKLKGKVE